MKGKIFLVGMLSFLTIFSQTLRYYIYEFPQPEEFSQVKVSYFLIVTDGEVNSPDFQEITLSEAIEKGYVPLEDSIIMGPRLKYGSRIDCRRDEHWKYAEFRSWSWYYQPTLMYLYGYSYWNGLWVGFRYAEINGQWVETYFLMQYDPSITAVLEQKGIHYFWVTPPPPPPPPSAPRGVHWSVNPKGSPSEPGDFGDGWERYESYDYKIF